MRVKIRFPEGAAAAKILSTQRGIGMVGPMAALAGGVLTLAAVACLTLAVWRLTSDLGWTGEFAISEGLLSHWQVWMTLTIGTGMVGVKLLRVAREREAAALASQE